jgi:hypothetical protein
VHVAKFFLKISLGSKKVSGEVVFRLVSSVFQSVYRAFSFSGQVTSKLFLRFAKELGQPLSMMGFGGEERLVV